MIYEAIMNMLSLCFENNIFLLLIRAFVGFL